MNKRDKKAYTKLAFKLKNNTDTKVTLKLEESTHENSPFLQFSQQKPKIEKRLSSVMEDIHENESARFQMGNFATAFKSNTSQSELKSMAKLEKFEFS